MSSLLPGSDPDDARPVDDGIADVEHDGRDRRRLLLIGGGAVVAIAAVGGFLFLHSGSSSAVSDALPTTPVVHTTPSPAVSASPTTSSQATSHGSGHKVLKVEHKATVRDPFKALLSSDTSSSGSSTTATAAATSSPESTGSSTSSLGSGGTSTTSGTTSTGTSSTTSTGSTSSGSNAHTYIQLVSTKGTSSAVVRVYTSDHKFATFTVKAPSASADTGTVFDTNFALFAVQSGAATVQYKDGPPLLITNKLVKVES